MAEMMKNVSPEQMQNMAHMAEQMQAGSGGPVGGQMPVDPSMAADMIKNMTPEQMAEMANAAKSSGMLPAGMNFDPEMIKVRKRVACLQCCAEASRLLAVLCGCEAPACSAVRKRVACLQCHSRRQRCTPLLLVCCSAHLQRL
jgi:hypothetical protein